MASFDGNIGTPSGYFNLKVEYSISQSVSGNYSDITATGYVKRNNSNAYPYNPSSNASLTIDGDKSTSSSSYDLRSDGYKNVMSKTKRVYHNSDGTKSITISFSFDGKLYSFYPNGSISRSITLPTIPRASDIGCSSPYIGDMATITISKKSSNFTNTVWYKFGSIQKTLATKTSDTVLSFDTNSIKSQLYEQIPNSSSGTGTMYCETFNGNTSIGTKSCNFSLYAKESDCKPDISADVIDTNKTITELLGSNKKFLKYLSKPKATVSSTAKYSASISNRTISLEDGQSYSGTSYTFDTISSNKVTATVKDSRGFSNSVIEELDMIDYVKLHINNLDIQRTEGISTEAILNLDGGWYNGKFTNALSNSLKILIQYKKSTDTDWIDYGEVEAETDGNKFSITGLSLSSIYDFEYEYQFNIVISDKLDKINQIDTLPKGREVVAIGEDKVWVYGDLLLNDNSIENKLEVTANGWNIKFSNGFMIQCRRQNHSPTFVRQNGQIYVCDFDVYDWDVPFNELYTAIPQVSKADTSRDIWIGQADYINNQIKNATNTYAGCYKVFTPASTQAWFQVSVIGFGTWK